MSQISVLVATTFPDIKAEVIAASVAARPDMHLAGNRPLSVAEVDAALKSVPISTGCALVLVRGPSESAGLTQRWLAQRSDLVVMLVDLVGDIVRIGLRDPSLDSMLTTLDELVERVGTAPAERVTHVKLHQLRPNKSAQLLSRRPRPIGHRCRPLSVEFIQCCAAP